MATFKFVFRPSAKAGRHEGSLSLRVIHGRRPKTVSLSCRLYAEEWDGEAQAVVYPDDAPKRAAYLRRVQDRIDTCTGKVNAILWELERKGTYATEEILEHYRESPDDGNLLGYARALGAELRRNGQYRTGKAYMTVCRGLVRFNSGIDISLSQIDSRLVKRFEAYLKENGKEPNTIGYYMRNLRVVYNRAVKANRIVATGENPFEEVFTGVEETKKRALTAREVNRLGDIDFESLLKEHRPGTQQYINIQNLYSAWRLFFFCLYAQGMCFVDLAYVKKSQIRDGVLRYYRKKTGKQIAVPVNEGMQNIIDSFAGETRNSRYLFPILKGAEPHGGNGENKESKNNKDDGEDKEGSDGNDNNESNRKQYETALRTQNRRLKRLAKMAGVEKTVSTHVARHSWATICKNEMLPLSVICEGLGHSSEKMTRKYLASFDHSILGNAGKTVLTAVSRYYRPANAVHPVPT